MVSQIAPVILLLAAALIKSGLSMDGLYYGVSQVEKVAKGICWHKHIKGLSNGQISLNLYMDCLNKLNFVETFLSLQQQFTDYELYIRTSKMISKKIGKTLPTYVTCAVKFLNYKPQNSGIQGRFFGFHIMGMGFGGQPQNTRMNWRPAPPVYRPARPRVEDFGIFLQDREVERYPYRIFTHCLLEEVAKQRERVALHHMRNHWLNPEKEIMQLKMNETPEEEVEEEIQEEEEKKEIEEDEPIEEEVAVEETEAKKPPFSIEDVEYGLAQAKRVATGVCWIEKLNKPYPENDGGDAFINCKKNHDYVKLFESCRDGIIGEVDDSEEVCWEGAMKIAVEKYLPTYTPCLAILKDDELPPNKDYGALVGDSDREEYPYKGYTHCLLEELEDDNGQQGLDDLKSKWENPKSFVEAMLEKENEHRSWHSSPPLEINDELSALAQSYADHLAAEVCEPNHMSSKDPARKYNGKKCGENVAESSELSLSDDEVAAVASVVWYKESELYPWPLFNGQMDVWTQNMVGHFTQSVWKDSTQVGYAVSKETESCQKKFVVARYWPVGNTFWKDEERTKTAFENNVLPSIK